MSNNIIKAGRRTGKTTMLVSHAVYTASTNPCIDVMLVAGMLTEVRILKQYVLRQLKGKEFFQRADDFFLDNGSRIFIRTADTSMTRGTNLHSLYVDNSDYISRKNLDNLHRSTLAKNKWWVENTKEEAMA